MKHATSVSGYTGRRLRQCTPALLFAITTISWLHIALPAFAAETGIRGTVLCGPLSPGPARPGQAEEGPLSAAFAVYDAAEKVAQFRSDEKGRFEVSLPAGAYTIIPDEKTPVPNARGQKTKVSVPADGFAVVTIRLDTGMR